MKDKTEARIQQEIFSFYKNNYCLNFHNPKHIIFAVPNDSSSKEETMRKLATGMMGGVSDLIIIQPNKLPNFYLDTNIEPEHNLLEPF